VSAPDFSNAAVDPDDEDEFADDVLAAPTPPKSCEQHPDAPTPGCPGCHAAIAVYSEYLQAQINELSSGSAKKSAATVLVELAMSRYYLGVTDEGEPFAVEKTGSHIARMLRGGKTGLRAAMSRAYFESQGRAAPQQALADALLVLEGRCADATPTPVHLRVAELDGVHYIDLGATGNDENSVVRLDGTGWTIAKDVPVLFRRTKVTGAFPLPVVGGSLSPLWELVNVSADEQPLVLAWLVAALIGPDIPHPILSLFAEQGSGKSNGSRALVGLVDPSPVPLRKPPKDADGWVTAASGSWAVCIDNLSNIPAWLSDSMCRAVTGDGDVRRALYTDGDLHVFSFRRCLLVNGIDIGAIRGDYAERSLVANLARIKPDKRRAEAELIEYWTAEHPRVFGALLDLAVQVVAVLPSVRLESSPRMADFARILAAVDQIMGTQGFKVYQDQSAGLAAESLESDPFMVALIEKVTTEFLGTSAELLARLRPDAETARTPEGWPKGARAVTGVLKRNAPALRSNGWAFEEIPRELSGRVKSLQYRITPPDLAERGSGNVAALPQPAYSQVTGPENVRQECGNDDEGNDGCRTCGKARQPSELCRTLCRTGNMPSTSSDAAMRQCGNISAASLDGHPPEVRTPGAEPNRWIVSGEPLATVTPVDIADRRDKVRGYLLARVGRANGDLVPPADLHQCVSGKTGDRTLVPVVLADLLSEGVLVAEQVPGKRKGTTGYRMAG
jgi:hypothetical protein